MAIPNGNMHLTEEQQSNFLGTYQHLRNNKVKNSIMRFLTKKEIADNSSLSNWIMENMDSFQNMEEVVEAMMSRLLSAENEKEEFKKKAYTCSLTKSLNRNFFTEFALEFDKRKITYLDKDNIYFYSLDLNKFKEINDTFGHQVGDEVLIEFSKRLGCIVRKEDLQTFDLEHALINDFFVRLGGDEFICKFKLASDDDAINLKKRIETIAEQPFYTSKGMLNIGVSVGFKKLEKNKKISDILHEADVKMYEEKRRK